MYVNLLLFIASFFILWKGAGLIIVSVEKLSHKLNISAFAASFFVLGILTSLPETMVGINSIVDGDPEIFVGNLIGASIVLLLLAIPLLAILGNGITLSHNMDSRTLLLALVVIAAPVFFIIDSNISLFEGVFMVAFYPVLFYSIEKKKGFLESIKDRIIGNQTHLFTDLLYILAGVVMVIISSKIIVEETLIFSRVFGMSTYLISLLFLSVGTNLPEISLAIRSVRLGKKEVALGDYIGSAAANTLLFGVLTVVNRTTVEIRNHFVLTLFFTVLGFSLFYFFTRSKNDISRKEGLVLLFVYIFFLLFESWIR